MNTEIRYRKGYKIGGRYIIHQPLKGGMGEVYLCYDSQGMEAYALKTFQKSYITTQLHKNLHAEIGNWISLEKHPNIVRCFFLKTIDDIPFIFLEWVVGDATKGISLRDRLNLVRKLSLQEALLIIVDICQGLVLQRKVASRQVE